MTNPTYNADMTNAQLVSVHNEMALKAGAPELKSWKSAKAKLIARMDDLVEQLELEDEAEAFEEAIEDFIVDGYQLRVVRKANEEFAKQEAEIEEEPAKAPPMKTMTIRERALELMCAIEYYEDKNKKPGPENRVEGDHKNARSVGLSYKEIVAMIREEFEGSETSVACLRWYAVKVRAQEAGYEGHRLCQRRPRTSGKK